MWLSRERICLQCRKPGFNPWVWKIPWRRERLPIPVFLPAEFHRSCSFWGCKGRARLKDFSLHFQEISPESRLDWSLPVPSGISSLKPAKTYTLAFPRSQLSPLDRKPSVVQTSSQRSRRTHRQMASLRSQVELQDHSRNQRSQPLGSAAPSFSIQRLYPDLSRKVTNRSRLTSGPSHCCSLTSLAPPLPAAGELFFPLIPA